MEIATMTFACPKCSLPGTLPMPEGEVLNSLKFSVAAWKSIEYTCPGCHAKFVTTLKGIKFEGQLWGIAEVPPQSKIVLAPIPFPPKGRG